MKFLFNFPCFLSVIFSVGEVVASRTPGFKSPVLIKCYKNWDVPVIFPNMIIFERSLCSCTQVCSY